MCANCSVALTRLRAETALRRAVGAALHSEIQYREMLVRRMEDWCAEMGQEVPGWLASEAGDDLDCSPVACEADVLAAAVDSDELGRSLSEQRRRAP